MCWLLQASGAWPAGQVGRQLYARLDSLVERRAAIEADKMRRIEGIRQILRDSTLTDAERYAVNERLFGEYLTLKYDSAYMYVTSNIRLADKMGDRHRATMSRLGQAHILAVAGLFDEAGSVLAAIDAGGLVGRETVEYYRQLYELYLFKSEFFSGTAFAEGYGRRMQDYRRPRASP